MTEYIVDLSEVEKTSDRFKMLFTESIPLGREIVRCKDCRWISKDTKHYKACYRLPDCEFMVEPDGFCWKGERNG